MILNDSISKKKFSLFKIDYDLFKKLQIKKLSNSTVIPVKLVTLYLSEFSDVI